MSTLTQEGIMQMITIICLSRRGLHKMLVLCIHFENENYIIFNTKKCEIPIYIYS